MNLAIIPTHQRAHCLAACNSATDKTAADLASVFAGEATDIVRPFDVDVAQTEVRDTAALADVADQTGGIVAGIVHVQARNNMPRAIHAATEVAPDIADRHEAGTPPDIAAGRAGCAEAAAHGIRCHPVHLHQLQLMGGVDGGRVFAAQHWQGAADAIEHGIRSHRDPVVAATTRCRGEGEPRKAGRLAHLRFRQSRRARAATRIRLADALQAGIRAAVEIGVRDAAVTVARDSARESLLRSYLAESIHIVERAAVPADEAAGKVCAADRADGIAIADHRR